MAKEITASLVFEHLPARKPDSHKGSYGKLVIVTHDDGSQTYYAHCSQLLVKYGDKVYQGQTIAKVGSTGNSTGPHLHFEIRIKGKTVDPLKYLP